jgi:hypothetical protein
MAGAQVFDIARRLLTARQTGQTVLQFPSCERGTMR